MNVTPMELPTWNDWCRFGSASRRPEIWHGMTMAYVPTLGATGQTLFEATRRFRDGTLTNFPTTAWSQTSPYGSWCLDYDGTNDHIATPGFINVTGPCTVSAWINTDTVAAGVRAVLGVGSGAAAFDLLLSINSTGGKIRWWWANSAILGSTITITTSTWYHVTAVRGGEAGAWTAALYVNGVLDASTTTATNPNGGAGTSVFTIGRLPTSGQYFDGLIGDVMMWDYDMNASQVFNLYSSGVEWLLPALPVYGKAPVVGVRPLWYYEMLRRRRGAM